MTTQQELVRHELQKDWLSYEPSLRSLSQRFRFEDGTPAPCVTEGLSCCAIHTSTYLSLAVTSFIWRQGEPIITLIFTPMFRQWRLSTLSWRVLIRTRPNTKLHC